MSILSNYTPNCLARTEVSCLVSDLEDKSLGMSAEKFASQFKKAVEIAQVDVHRATTHNKGIFNGVDAVVLASGNDFRAVESCGHTYACRDGKYRSLSNVKVENGVFTFWMDLPLALGTVGGLTSLHPLSRISLEMLGKPGAKDLMKVASAVGLAQNFGALRSLVTTGIQKGHMKMHLMNILNQLKADDRERDKAKSYFVDKTISYNDVESYITSIREYH